jgi:hypothetical protein
VKIMAWIRDLMNSGAEESLERLDESFERLEEGFESWIAWRSACDAVDATYRDWTSAPVAEREFAFERYRAALALEEERASTYAAVAIAAVAITGRRESPSYS